MITPVRARKSLTIARTLRSTGQPLMRRAFSEEGHLARHLRDGARPRLPETGAWSAGLYFLSDENTIRKKRSFEAEGKARHVEDRVIGHGQSVESQHAEDSGDSARTESSSRT